MVGENCKPSVSKTRAKVCGDVRPVYLNPQCNYLYRVSATSSSISPAFHSPVFNSSRRSLGLVFLSSIASPQTPTPKITSTSHQVPPPVNPPETEIPDPATLKEQWRYATRLYSRWYAHAWGTAILAGASFYALGWLIKGENPAGKHEKKEEE
ncbi:hypothetical protein MPTK1_6g10560 [Marchantia polymorpha subsp. ruderalis]|uniref:Uncharacterized protein n=2 Tax=Marchantia polymorpha TaxID=3197 RepID=A0AAF6BQM2_MARPO|nr:hypothetical protein MARPO_0016s0097 [Marchantia polymorpha]BBN14306.1 hypothetical protein Mp_6g10560 [Marchantia polymorpha subsp. ruderalis]|eukprot:PTQ45040.1 hypothetical protein MARPO_0016s0097 [Marchantia polymorpha]